MYQVFELLQPLEERDIVLPDHFVKTNFVLLYQFVVVYRAFLDKVLVDGPSRERL